MTGPLSTLADETEGSSQHKNTFTLVSFVHRLHQEGINVGFPVLVKAALGGGGKGMKLATKEGELKVNFSKPATFCCSML